MRPLSYLSDESLSSLLALALAIARRRGGGYDRLDCWRGPALPLAAVMIVDEYKQRRAHRP